MSEQRPHWSGGNWLASPWAWLDDGVLLDLDKTAILALLTLCKHADFTTGGNARPGMDVIGAAISKAADPKDRRRAAERALRTLERLGLVELVERGGGRERANVYRLTTGNPGAQTGVSEGETPAADAPKPRWPVRQTPVAGSLNPGAPTGPTYRTNMRTNPENKEGRNAPLNGNELSRRLEAMNFGSQREREKLVRENPERVGKALAVMDRIVEAAKAKGQPIRQPAKILRRILQGAIATGDKVGDLMARASQTFKEPPKTPDWVKRLKVEADVAMLKGDTEREKHLRGLIGQGGTTAGRTP